MRLPGFYILDRSQSVSPKVGLYKKQLWQKYVAHISCAVILACGGSIGAQADNEVVSEPKAIAPGETVKLRWYFTGTRVVVSGGRFGTGVTVTGKTLVSDTPKKTTVYSFDVWYPDVRVAPSPEKAAPLIHQKYTVTAYVDNAGPDRLTSYADSHGWKLQYLANWKRDVSTPDDGREAITFFQKEYDSVERMAIAIVPANELDSSALLAKALADAPARYADLKIEPEKSITVSGLPAAMATFTGMDMTHPGVKTTSELYAVVSGSRAYVVSFRTRASEFPLRQRHLEPLLRSFSLAHPYPATGAVHKPDAGVQ